MGAPPVIGQRHPASRGSPMVPPLARGREYPARVSKLTPKIILEGTRLTHKTDLAFALNEHPRIVGPRRYRYHSPLISAEWCGFTPVPWGRGPINFEPGGEEQERAMAVFDAWVRLIELQPHYSWIIDRFHLSARAYQLAEHGLDLDFSALEARLRALDVHVVLCTRRDGTWEAARAERLLVSGNPSQYDDLVAVPPRAGAAPPAGVGVDPAGPGAGHVRRGHRRGLRARSRTG